MTVKQHLTGLDRLLEGCHEVHVPLKVVDVHRETIVAKAVDQVIGQATNMARSVITTIADDYARHPAPLPTPTASAPVAPPGVAQQ